MTYPCTTCILDHMAASGPQTQQDLRRECCTQAVPYSPALFEAAVVDLLTNGRIVIDHDGENEDWYDFPDSYYL